MMARDGLRQETDEHAPSIETSDAPAPIKAPNDARIEVDLRTILGRLATQIADSDRRHGAALQDLQSRLAAFDHGTAEPAAGAPAECSDGFDRLETQITQLIDRLEIAEAQGDAVAPMAAATANAAAQPAAMIVDRAQAAANAWPEATADAAGSEESAASDNTLDEIYASIKSAFREPDCGSEPLSHESGNPPEANGAAYVEATRQSLSGSQTPADFSASAAPAATDMAVEEAGTEPVESENEAPFEGWNDDGSWDEDTAEALANTYAESEQLARLSTPGSARAVAMVTPIGVPEVVADIKELDGRFEELTGALEARIRDVVPEGTFAKLAERFDALDAKIATLQEAGGNDDVVAAIEAQMAEMLGQIDRIAADAGRIETVEEGLSLLLDDVAATRADLPQIVEAATSGAAASVSTAAMSEDATQDKLDAVFEMLQGLTEGGTAIAGANHSGFETIAASLDDIARRLEDIEALAMADPYEEEIPYQAPQHLAEQTDGDARPHGDELPAEIDTALGAAEPHGEEDADEAFADEPEPGAMPTEATEQPAAPRREIRAARSMRPAAQKPADRIAAIADGQVDQSAQAEQFSEEIPGSDAAASRVKITGDDFLATARRAAQAVGISQSETPKAAAIPKEKTDPSKRRGLLSFEKRSPTPVLVIAILALLAAGGGLIYTKISKRNNNATANFGASAPAKSDQSSDFATGDEFAPVENAPAGDRESRLSDSPRFAKSSHESDGIVTDGSNSVLGIVVDDTYPNDGSTRQQSLSGRSAGAVSDNASGSSGLASRAKPVAMRPADTAVEPLLRTATANPAPTSLDLPPEGSGSFEERLSAAQGDQKAQFAVATRLATGAAGKRDEAAAVIWYQRAAANGYPPAQYRLGTHYERGRGVSRDLERAKIWYSRAAKRGHVKSMHNLGVLLAGARNGQPNYVGAVSWFQKAADRGLTDSQFNLAILYQNGLGVGRNPIKGYEWFAIAAKGGDKSAAKRRDALRSELAADPVAAADARVAKWRPMAIDATANADGSNEPGRARATAPETPAPSAAAKLRPLAPAIAAPSRLAPTISNDVLRAQQLLSKLGYDAGPADGQMGRKTAAAVRRFEARNGLVPTGRLNPEVMKMLERMAG